MRHADQADSTHAVKTDYGVFYVCTPCLPHVPPKAGTLPARHPASDTRGCECEHVSHAAAGIVDEAATVNRDQLKRVIDELQAGERLTIDHLIRIFGVTPIATIFHEESRP